MPNSSVTTTVIRVDFVSDELLHVLVCSNDIRENYVSELRRIDRTNRRASDILLHRKEWLTNFYSPDSQTSYVSRWDNTIYLVRGSATDAVKRPCEAITRMIGAPDGRVFATCYEGLVQMLEADAWRSLDMKRNVDLFHVVADGPNAFFVCGAEATLARWQDGHWSFIDLPTSADFFALAVCADGDIVVCGDHVLFKGRAEEWVSIDTPDATFHHALRVGEKVYLSGGEKGLFYLEHGEVRPFDTDVYAYHCDARGESIVCCGANVVHVFHQGQKHEIAFDDLF
ncbi:hypothetical protein NKJ46_15100 [Mesorhizobium sp. M0166]|uniref:hypothetical protein n=1 Tax=Mesorhizobium sp. M0166 TaxID=2956902 RepID=UPI00333A6B01